MKVLIGSSLTLVKIGILTAAVVATLSLAHQPSAESSSTTRIVLSYSSAAPIQAQAIILNPGGLLRDIYVWALGVKEPTGVSAFNIAIEFDETALNVTHGFSGDIDGIGDKTWLESSSRQGACVADPNPDPGIVVGECFTLQPPPPLGPLGSGLIGHILLWPGVQMAPTSQLKFVEPAFGVLGTYLLDTPLDPDDIQRIPVTLVNSTVIFMGCADNSPPPNGDGVVDLPNDILGVILRFQMTSSHPDWSDLFDINSDGVIDLPNDILGTILQFQLPCNQP